MTIIHKTAKSIEHQSHRSENWNGADWLEVPSKLEQSVIKHAPYCDLTIENGRLTGVTPTERPASQAQITPMELAQQEITERMLADIERGQEITDLQIMLMEEQK